MPPPIELTVEMSTQLTTFNNQAVASPSERFVDLSQLVEFDMIASFLTDFGETVLPEGNHDVVTNWCVSALPETGLSTDGRVFRALTINAGKMEVAYIQIRDDDYGRWAFGCVYVRRTHFLAAANQTLEQLSDANPLLDFNPDVTFKAARLNGQQDALAIYCDLTDPASADQLEALLWRPSARALVDHLRQGPLMPKWAKAHSSDLARLIAGDC